jgi:hypothetical protein
MVSWKIKKINLKKIAIIFFYLEKVPPIVLDFGVSKNIRGGP